MRQRVRSPEGPFLIRGPLWVCHPRAPAAPAAEAGGAGGSKAGCAAACCPCVRWQLPRFAPQVPSRHPAAAAATARGDRDDPAKPRDAYKLRGLRPGADTAVVGAACLGAPQMREVPVLNLLTGGQGGGRRRGLRVFKAVCMPRLTCAVTVDELLLPPGRPPCACVQHIAECLMGKVLRYVRTRPHTTHHMCLCA